MTGDYAFRAGVGGRIRLLMDERGLDCGAFAELIGVSPYTLTSWVSGYSVPETRNVIRICEACDVSADWLLGIKRGGKPTPIAVKPEPSSPVTKRELTEV
jgi:transcriptional regulator with XRE-family HTH domain